VFLLLFYRAIAGAMAGTAVVTQASIGRTVEPGLQSVAMGYLGAASNLAIVLAPVAGAAFLYLIDAGNTTRWVFVVSAMVSVVAGTWSLAWFKVPPPEQLPQRNQNSLKNLLGRMNVATRRKSITVAMIGGGIAFTNFVLLAVLPLSIQRRFGWEGRELALLLFFSAGAAVLSQTFLMKRAITFIREEALLSLALCMLCVGTFGFGFVQSGLVASSCYVVFLATYSVANSVLGGMLSRCAEPSGRASLFGYYTSFRNLAQIAGPLLAAVAFERWGIEYAIIVATIIAAMMFGAGLSLTLKSRLIDVHGAL
jgi:MFS family permease